MKRPSIITFFLCITAMLLSSCTAMKNNSKQTIAIALKVNTDEPQLNNMNWNLYGIKVVRQLENFNAVNLDISDEDSASIRLMINVDRFNAFPPDQRMTQRVFSKNIQVGTNTEGKPVYQTVVATANLVQTTFRSSAVFNVNLNIKGQPGKTFKRTFNENMNVQNVHFSDIRGDQRALDPRVYTLTMPPETPMVDDMLLALSNREMLERLSREIRLYYGK